MKRIIKVVAVLTVLVVGFNLLTMNRTKLCGQTSNEDYAYTGMVDTNTTFNVFRSKTKEYIDYKQNGNAPWRNKSYWDGTMASSGCGITVMASVLSGYGKGVTPEDLRQKYYPKLDYETLATEFANYGIEAKGFYYDKRSLSTLKIRWHLRQDKPVIVCLWTQNGENRWTKSSHYMALVACDSGNNVYVLNPNGTKAKENQSGWYHISEIQPFIAKIMYID